MPKKALILVTKGEVGGAQNFVFNLAKGLKDSGADVCIGTGAGGSYLQAQAAEAGISFAVFTALSRSYNPFRVISTYYYFKKFFDRNKFDTVQLNSSNALPVAMAAKMSKNKPKTIFTFHGLSFLDPGSKKNPILKFLFQLYYKIFLFFVDEKVFVCRANLEYAKKTGLVKSGRVIYNGIRVKHIEKNMAREFLSKKTGIDLADKPVVGSIGRLAYPKNYEFFILNFADIVKITPDAVGIIIGDGPERKKYEHQIEKSGLKGRFFLIGEIRDASRYLSGFDIFTLTSEFEGQPITLLEAMTAGVPVLVPKVGGISEVLNNDSVQLYVAGSDAEYREKLRTLLYDADLRNKSGSANSQRADEFSFKNMVDEYLNIL